MPTSPQTTHTHPHACAAGRRARGTTGGGRQRAGDMQCRSMHQCKPKADGSSSSAARKLARAAGPGPSPPAVRAWAHIMRRAAPRLDRARMQQDRDDRPADRCQGCTHAWVCTRHTPPIDRLGERKGAPANACVHGGELYASSPIAS